MNHGCACIAAAPARLRGGLSCTSIITSIFSSRLDNSAILICFRQKLGREGLPRNRLRGGNKVLWLVPAPLPPPPHPGTPSPASGEVGSLSTCLLVPFSSEQTSLWVPTWPRHTPLGMGMKWASPSLQLDCELLEGRDCVLFFPPRLASSPRPDPGQVP